MKAIVTVLCCTILFATATASNIDGIKIAPNAKTTNIEVRLTAKKAMDATIVITNAAGVLINKQAVKLTNGNNAIVLLDLAKLEDGNYTVTMTAGVEIMTTNFMNWKL
jgi:hypothetical protein